MTAGRASTLADDVLNLVADSLQGNRQRLKGLGGDAFTLVDEPEQNVLCADVVVVQEASFLLGQNDNSASSVCKAFEH